MTVLDNSGRLRKEWLPEWLRSYRREYVLSDSIAGVIVTALLVPQSLAYAMVAGLPPHVGMYASILPVLAYAAFGSSRTLAVGPVAVAALMTAAALSPLAEAGSAEYVALAVLLALLVGVQLFVLGLLRMGFIANLLSHPVVSGFVTGSALLIAIGQLEPLLGIPAEGQTALRLLGDTIARASALHIPTAAVGLSGLALLWAAKRFLPVLARQAGASGAAADLATKLVPMAVVLLAIGAVSGWELDTRSGVAVVGAIPGGLPSLSLVWPTSAQFSALLLPAFMIALVSFVESVAVAQSLGIKRGQHIDPDAELRGLGAANVASAVSGGFPVAGGFSRSVVNFAAGAQTPMAGIVSAGLMAVILLGLTESFQRLPLAVLAATIIAAVLGLVDVATVRRAWRYDRADASAWAATAAGVLVLGVEFGVALGVALSVATFLWRASRPHMVVLGRVRGTEHFRNERRFPVETHPRVLLIRIDENLFFANIATVVNRVMIELRLRPETSDLVLVLSSVSHVDLTAAQAVLELQADLEARKVRLHLAEVKGPVLDRLAAANWLKSLAQKPFLSVHEAVEALTTEAGPARDARPPDSPSKRGA